MNLSLEARERISAANKGKPKSPAHKAKLSAALKGRALSPETRAKMSQTRKGRPLVGDDIGYRTAHRRAVRYLENEHACSLCGGTDRMLHAALRHDTDPQRIRREATGINAGKPYSPKPHDYERLCVPCHKAHDKEAPWRSA
jgi:hypothetical protein